MNEPLVSIIIPVYNGANYLRQAIESALAQDYERIEVIVVDDGSTDGGKTSEIARSYGNRVRVIAKDNGGSSSALNVGLQAMRGEFFSWLSHDDLYDKRKISRQIAALEAFRGGSETTLACTQAVVCESESIDSTGRILRRPSAGRMRRRSRRLKRLPGVQLVTSLQTDFKFHGCAYLISRDLLLDVGGFDEGLRYVNDADMWFRVFSRHQALVYVPEILVQGRMHREQITEAVRVSGQGADERQAHMARVIDWTARSDHRWRGWALLRMSSWLAARGRHGSAALAFKRSCGVSPVLSVVAVPVLGVAHVVGVARAVARKTVWRLVAARRPRAEQRPNEGDGVAG